MLVTTVGKEFVVVEEMASVAETELENEFMTKPDVREVFVISIDGVEADIVVVKAAMAVLFVSSGCSMPDEVESGARSGEQMHLDISKAT